MSVDKKMIKDDLYEAVNGDWIKNAKIPDDKPATGGFNDLVDKIDKQMMDDFDAYAEGKQKSDDARFNEMIKLYKIAKKFDFRKKVGPKALKRVLSSVEELKSYDDYQAQWRNWIMYGLPSPVTFDIDADMKNTTVYALFASSPSLILPDKSYYTPEKKQEHDQLLKLWTDMVTTLMDKLGYDKDEAAQIIQHARILMPSWRQTLRVPRGCRLHQDVQPADGRGTDQCNRPIGSGQRDQKRLVGDPRKGCCTERTTSRPWTAS